MPPVIAIDWSGSKTLNNGAIAVARAVDGVVSLCPPPQKNQQKNYWTRHDVALFLQSEIIKYPDLIIGIDAALSLPWIRAKSYFNTAPARASDLWALIDGLCQQDGDFLGTSFWTNKPYCEDFWIAGARPQNFMDEPHREIEIFCRDHHIATPETPYKLIGTKQVGKGSLAAMRLLHFLQGKIGELRVWPFAEFAEGQPIFCEIYPRLFLKQAGFGQQKIRNLEDLEKALFFFEHHCSGLDRVDDHQSDAIISAAAMAHYLNNADNPWAVDRLPPLARQFEGWIFAV